MPEAAVDLDLFDVIRYGRRAAIDSRVNESYAVRAEMLARFPTSSYAIVRIGSDDYEYSGGQCSTVAQMMQVRYGLEVVYGCHHATTGPYAGKHVWHAWNRLPDGRILDCTADQFGCYPDGWLLVSGDDPRYVVGCDHEGIDA